MSRTIGLLVCLSVVAMDITAGVLGIKAEAAQDQMKHVKLWLFECKEPSHEAFTLGAAAASLLGLAHVIANMLGTCTICSQEGTQKSSPSRHCSLACLLLTWYVKNF
ncbi:hypothetical protein RHGRI_017843 [Rhododendron griersonianum]|uniref:Uncharacterized protein n=1 Tax=Rhododendron griersonianum TaxID=479676 RepID=A0AAV6JZ86_9ERIC|nr:hypothetical protein RHGRI_017843 [Rhododendron griersonianum]